VVVNARSPLASVVRFYKLAHERLLKASEDLSPAQFTWSAGESLHSVAWQLWHAARWDDVFAAHVQKDFGREPAAQVWEREGLDAVWSLAPGSMGLRDAGTGMENSAAEQMRFPEQSEAIGYARRVFDFAVSAIAAIPEDQLCAVPKGYPDGDTYLDHILSCHEHLNRHLGTIETIRGLQGLLGSAT